MAHLTLNCPHCRRRLVYVPLDGLTLYYHCEEHGALILRPLKPVPMDEVLAGPRQEVTPRMRVFDAA